MKMLTVVAVMTAILFVGGLLCAANGLGDNDKAQVVQTSSATESAVSMAAKSIKSIDQNNRTTIASDSDVDQWGRWLDVPDLFPREEGAYWLGKSNNPRAIPYLLKALKDPEPTVRGYPAWDLGGFNDERIKPALVEGLKGETSLRVQKNLIKSIRKIGATSVDEGIIEKCEKELKAELQKLVLSGRDGLKKTRAAWEMVNVLHEDPEKYEDLMIKVLNSNSTEEEKILAIRILEKIYTKKSTSSLNKALNDKNAIVRTEAESALQKGEKSK